MNEVEKLKKIEEHHVRGFRVEKLCYQAGCVEKNFHTYCST